MINSSFSRLFWILIFLTTHHPSYSGNEDREFELQRVQLASRIERLFIDHGHCKSIADCRLKKVLSISPSLGGLDIKIYSLTDGLLLKYVFEECLKTYLENSKAINIKIEVYELAKDDHTELKFWQSGRPIFSGELKGNK